jgi:endonuclease III
MPPQMIREGAAGEPGVGPMTTDVGLNSLYKNPETEVWTRFHMDRLLQKLWISCSNRNEGHHRRKLQQTTAHHLLLRRIIIDPHL